MYNQIYYTSPERNTIMLKKILAIILATVLCFCFTACEEEENIYNENKSEGTVTKDATNGKNPKEEKINIYKLFQNFSKINIEIFINTNFKSIIKRIF